MHVLFWQIENLGEKSVNAYVSRSKETYVNGQNHFVAMYIIYWDMYEVLRRFAINL